MEKYEEMHAHRIEGPEGIFSWAWHTVEKNLKKLYSIAVIPVALFYLGMIVFAIDPGLVMVSVVLYVVAAVIGVAMIPAVITSIHELSTGSSIGSVKARYTVGFKLIWTTLGAMVLTLLVTIGSVSLFIIPGVIAAFYLQYYLYSAIVDKKGAFGSLQESFRLVRGRWWAVLARTVFLGIVAQITYYVFYLLFMALSIVFSGIGAPIVSFIVLALLGVVFVPVVIITGFAYQYRTWELLKKHPLPEKRSAKSVKGLTIAFIVIGAIVLVFGIFMVGSAASAMKKSGGLRQSPSAYQMSGAWQTR